MKKKGLHLILAVGLLAVLLVVYMLLVKSNEQNENAEEEVAEKVLPVVSEDIVEVSFLIDGSEETFTFEEDAWKLSSDDEFPVNSSTISTMLSTVTEMTSNRTLNDVSDLAEYGLNESVQTMMLKDKSGNVYTICWGISNSVTGDEYLYLQEDPTTVYTVASTVHQAIGTTLEEFRQEETGETVTEEAMETTVETTEE